MANYEKIKIVKTEEKTSKTGNKFRIYKTIDPDTGRMIDLRFTKAVKNTPEERCFVIVPEGGANIDRTKEYPICWVKKLAKIQPFASEAPKPSGFEKVSEEELAENPF